MWKLEQMHVKQHMPGIIVGRSCYLCHCYHFIIVLSAKLEIYNKGHKSAQEGQQLALFLYAALWQPWPQCACTSPLLSGCLWRPVGLLEDLLCSFCWLGILPWSRKYRISLRFLFFLFLALPFFLFPKTHLSIPAASAITSGRCFPNLYPQHFQLPAGRLHLEVLLAFRVNMSKTNSLIPH